MYLLHIVAFLNGILYATSKKVPGGVSKSYQVVPDVVWTFTSSSHQSNSHLKEAQLRNVEFKGNYNGDRALEFKGTKTSYVTINNNDGFFDGTDMGAWFFYIKPDTGLTKGTIFEYEDDCPGGNGLSVSYDKGKIKIGFSTSAGHYVTGTSKKSLNSGTWTFIGVSWHVQNPSVMFYLEGEKCPETLALHSINSGQSFKATGHVRFGGSFDTSKSSFKGELRCIIYQDGYYFKKYTPQSFCDSSLRTSFVEGGTKTANSIGSTCLSIPQPTPIAIVPTVQSVQATISPMFTSAIFNSTNTAASTAIQTTPVVILQGTKMVIVEETCNNWSTYKAAPSNRTLLGTHAVVDIMSCAKLCKDDTNCPSFWTNSSSVGPGICVLGNPENTTYASSPDFRFFVL